MATKVKETNNFKSEIPKTPKFPSLVRIIALLFGDQQPAAASLGPAAIGNYGHHKFNGFLCVAIKPGYVIRYTRIR